MNTQYDNYFFEKCYYLKSGIMIGYSLDQSSITVLSVFLTQIDSYILAFVYKDNSMSTIECTISTLYYI